MKILISCARIPSPNKKGDQVVAYHRIISLSKSNEIELICYGSLNDSDDLKIKKQFEALGIMVVFVEWSTFTALLNVFMAIFNPSIPFQCAYFKSKKYKEKLASINDELKPDLTYIFLMRNIVNFDRLNCRYVIDLIDSFSLNFSRKLTTAKWYLKPFIKLELSRVKKFERLVADNSLISFVVSDLDKQAIGSSKIFVVPLGVDTSIFYNQKIEQHNSSIIFTGNLSYKPNIDAVLWFVNNCWGLIQAKLPGVNLRIVGGEPASEILALGKLCKFINVTGRVDSVADELNNAMVAIAPMQSGSGMQFKILEAMACGTPVITTTLGLGYIKAQINTDLLVCDSAESYVDKIIYLIKNSDVKQKIGKNGLEFVVKNHSWSVVNKLQYTKMCVAFNQASIAKAF